MPRKSNAFAPRIYTRKKPAGIKYYIMYWLPEEQVQAKRKYHPCHDDLCTCGKPRPNRPCEHLKVAQDVLQTFEHKLRNKAFDAPIEYIIEEWKKTAHVGRSPRTVQLYLGTYRIFLNWCNDNGKKTLSQLTYEALADFKEFLGTATFEERTHTPESKKILRQIDYIVRRDKITRKSAEYEKPEYQDLVRKMQGLMQVEVLKYEEPYIDVILRNLRTLFNSKLCKKLMTENPLSGIGKQGSEKLISSSPAYKEKNPLTLDERERILANTTGDTRDMTIVFLYAGLRLGELLNLHWHTHIKDNRIHITEVDADPKGSHQWSPKWKISRIIPMHPMVKEVLDRRRAENPDSLYVFSTTGRNGLPVRFGERNLQTRFSKVFKALDIVGEERNGVSIHCFRHTFITMLLHAGEPLLKVKTMAGHKDIRTTMIYAHRVEQQESVFLHTIR